MKITVIGCGNSGLIHAAKLIENHHQVALLKTSNATNNEFYRNGLTDIPITATDHIEPFLKEDIPQQWAYYCCVEYKKVGNRFLCFPAYRNARDGSCGAGVGMV